MDCRLRVEAPDQAPRDVFLEIDGGRSVAELTAALGRHLGQTRPDLAIYHRRTASWLRPDASVGEAGLQEGDRVVVGAPGSVVGDIAADPQARVDVVVVSGPCTGIRERLPVGEHEIGRASRCRVAIPDPAVSRVHLLVSVEEDGGVWVRDAGSRNGSWVEDVPIHEPLRLAPDQEVEVGGSLIRIAPSPTATVPAPDADGTVRFNRPPRNLPAGPDLHFRMDAPPRAGRSATFSITSALVPLVMGIALYAFTRSPLSMLMALLSPVMVVGGFVEGRLGGRRDSRQERQLYQRRLDRMRQSLAMVHRREERRRHLLSPDLPTLLRRARTAAPSLWERRPGDPDFLLLRLGWGDLPSGITLDLAEGGDPDDRARILDFVRRRQRLPSVPLSVSLVDCGSLGLAGPPELVAGEARSLIAQLAALHSPKELMLAGVIARSHRDAWRWVGWLPHLRPEVPAIAGPAVADSPLGARELLDRVQDLISERRQASEASYGSGQVASVPALVLLLDAAADLPRVAIDRLLAEGPRCGVHVIWLGTRASAIPGGCGAVLDIDPRGAARLRFAGSVAPLDGFGSDLASPALAEEVALALAPLRDVEAGGREGEIPRYVSLLELLRLERDGAAGVAAAWQRDDGRLAGLVGRAAGHEPFGVSLRQDGPHALAGGMTGSGKSELLQTLVAGLAAAHSPRRLTFLLVDYKGGAAFRDFLDLPHTVGYVTDLDGHLVRRALTSLRAELRRREETLSERGYPDLIQFEERDPERAFPSLFIVVDEFAALVGELPEFVDGMVDIAQRGRSLGIHLLLATQRPTGIINDRIWVNTNLRLSLRFSDAADSQGVIGTADAARPGLPRGRAFARSGPGLLTEFQAAHASGRTATDEGPAPILVRDLDPWGEPLEAAAAGGDRASESDLQRVVRAVREAAERLAVPAPSRPWLPTLPALLPLDDLESTLPPDWRERAVAPLGLVDDPARQRQYPLGFDLAEDGNLLVYGRGGSGKTTVLRTMAASLARRLPPDRLHVYGLDFATRGLRALLGLPHCGDVVCGDEPERGVRLLRMLREEQERRRSLLAARGASTLDEHERGGGSPLPRILVLLDGYTGFASSYENVELGAPIDLLKVLIAEGRPLGMSFVVTASRSGALPAAMAASATRRLILAMANDDEYLFLGLDRAVYQGADLSPGRGFADQGLELQTPVLGDDPGGAAQAREIGRIATELAARYEKPDVPHVRLLPTEIGARSLPAPTRRLEAVVGLRDEDLGPARIELVEGHALIAGPRRSGRSTTLASVALSLRSAAEPVPLFLVSPRRQSPLAGLDLWRESGVGHDAALDLAGRLARSLAGEGSIDLSRGAVVLVDDGEELLNGADGGALETLARQGRDRDLRLVAVTESQAGQRAYGGWLAEIQRDRQGVLLDPDPTLDGALVGGARLPKRAGSMPVGRAYLVQAGLVSVIQVARL